MPKTTKAAPSGSSGVYESLNNEHGENVSSDDSDCAPAKELPTQPDDADRQVQGFNSVLTQRRNTAIYSFTRNIDYDKVTDA